MPKKYKTSREERVSTSKSMETLNSGPRYRGRLLVGAFVCFHSVITGKWPFGDNRTRSQSRNSSTSDLSQRTKWSNGTQKERLESVEEVPVVEDEKHNVPTASYPFVWTYIDKSAWYFETSDGKVYSRSHASRWYDGDSDAWIPADPSKTAELEKKYRHYYYLECRRKKNRERRKLLEQRKGDAQIRTDGNGANIQRPRTTGSLNLVSKRRHSAGSVMDRSDLPSVCQSMPDINRERSGSTGSQDLFNSATEENLDTFWQDSVVTELSKVTGESKNDLAEENSNGQKEVLETEGANASEIEQRIVENIKPTDSMIMIKRSFDELSRHSSVYQVESDESESSEDEEEDEGTKDDGNKFMEVDFDVLDMSDDEDESENDQETVSPTTDNVEPEPEMVPEVEVKEIVPAVKDTEVKSTLYLDCVSSSRVDPGSAKVQKDPEKSAVEPPSPPPLPPKTHQNLFDHTSGTRVTLTQQSGKTPPFNTENRKQGEPPSPPPLPPKTQRVELKQKRLSENVAGTQATSKYQSGKTPPLPPKKPTSKTVQSDSAESAKMPRNVEDILVAEIGAKTAKLLGDKSILQRKSSKENQTQKDTTVLRTSYDKMGGDKTAQSKSHLPRIDLKKIPTNTTAQLSTLFTIRTYEESMPRNKITNILSDDKNLFRRNSKKRMSAYNSIPSTPTKPSTGYLERSLKTEPAMKHNDRDTEPRKVTPNGQVTRKPGILKNSQIKKETNYSDKLPGNEKAGGKSEQSTQETVPKYQTETVTNKNNPTDFSAHKPVTRNVSNTKKPATPYPNRHETKNLTSAPKIEDFEAPAKPPDRPLSWTTDSTQNRKQNDGLIRQYLSAYELNEGVQIYKAYPARTVSDSEENQVPKKNFNVVPTPYKKRDYGNDESRRTSGNEVYPPTLPRSKPPTNLEDIDITPVPFLDETGVEYEIEVTGSMEEVNTNHSYRSLLVKGVSDSSSDESGNVDYETPPRKEDGKSSTSRQRENSHTPRKQHRKTAKERQRKKSSTSSDYTDSDQPQKPSRSRVLVLERIDPGTEITNTRPISQTTNYMPFELDSGSDSDKSDVENVLTTYVYDFELAKIEREEDEMPELSSKVIKTQGDPEADFRPTDV